MTEELYGKDGLSLYQYVWKRAEKDEFFRSEIIGEYLDLLEIREETQEVA